MTIDAFRNALHHRPLSQQERDELTPHELFVLVLARRLDCLTDAEQQPLEPGDVQFLARSGLIAGEAPTAKERVSHLARKPRWHRLQERLTPCVSLRTIRRNRGEASSGAKAVCHRGAAARIQWARLPTVRAMTRYLFPIVQLVTDLLAVLLLVAVAVATASLVIGHQPAAIRTADVIQTPWSPPSPRPACHHTADSGPPTHDQLAGRLPTPR